MANVDAPVLGNAAETTIPLVQPMRLNPALLAGLLPAGVLDHSGSEMKAK